MICVFLCALGVCPSVLIYDSVGLCVLLMVVDVLDMCVFVNNSLRLNDCM